MTSVDFVPTIKASQLFDVEFNCLVCDSLTKRPLLFVSNHEHVNNINEIIENVHNTVFCNLENDSVCCDGTTYPKNPDGLGCMTCIERLENGDNQEYKNVITNAIKVHKICDMCLECTATNDVFDYCIPCEINVQPPLRAINYQQHIQRPLTFFSPNDDRNTDSEDDSEGDDGAVDKLIFELYRLYQEIILYN